jgi:hypothetical protein
MYERLRATHRTLNTEVPCDVMEVGMKQAPSRGQIWENINTDQKKERRGYPIRNDNDSVFSE